MESCSGIGGLAERHTPGSDVPAALREGYKDILTGFARLSLLDIRELKFDGAGSVEFVATLQASRCGQLSHLLFSATDRSLYRFKLNLPRIETLVVAWTFCLEASLIVEGPLTHLICTKDFGSDDILRIARSLARLIRHTSPTLKYIHLADFVDAQVLTAVRSCKCLEVLIFDGRHNPDETEAIKELIPWYGHKLKALVLINIHTVDDLIPYIEASCRQLRQLVLGKLETSLSSETVARILSVCPQIRDFIVMEKLSEFAGFHLANFPEWIRVDQICVRDVLSGKEKSVTLSKAGPIVGPVLCPKDLRKYYPHGFVRAVIGFL